MFIANFLYELPFFRGQTSLAGKILGGWQISGIAQYQTGTPCSVGVNNDYVGVGQDGSMCGIGQFWNMNGDPTVLGNFAAGGSSDPALWFATTNPDGSPIFTAPAAGTFVHQDGVRNSVYGPGFQNWNLGLFKRFAVNERSGFEFRAEAFDAFNHPNLNGPDRNPTSGSFGKVTGKNNDARNLQFRCDSTSNSHPKRTQLTPARATGRVFLSALHWFCADAPACATQLKTGGEECGSARLRGRPPL